MRSQHLSLHAASAPSLALSTLALALGWAMPVQAQAVNDPTAAFAHAELTNFNYHLVDLDLNDGVAPSIVFQPIGPMSKPDDPVVDGYGNAYGLFRWLPAQPGDVYRRGEFPTTQAGTFDRTTSGVPSSWLPTDDINLTSGDGTAHAVLGPAGLSSTTTLTGANIASALQEESRDADGKVWNSMGAQSQSFLGFTVGQYPLRPVGEWVTDPATGLTVLTDPRFKYAPTASQYVLSSFVLSPNTAVVFDGVLSAEAQIDVSKVEGFVPGTSAASAMAVANLELFRDAPKDGQTVWNTYDEAKAALDITRLDIRAEPTVGYNTSEELTGSVAHKAASKTFSIELRNDDASAMVGHLSGATTGTVSFEWVAASVPEPSTYALMGLGIIGVGLAARRRQAAQA